MIVRRVRCTVTFMNGQKVWNSIRVLILCETGSIRVIILWTRHWTVMRRACSTLNLWESGLRVSCEEYNWLVTMEEVTFQAVIGWSKWATGHNIIDLMLDGQGCFPTCFPSPRQDKGSMPGSTSSFMPWLSIHGTQLLIALSISQYLMLSIILLLLHQSLSHLELSWTGLK